VGEQSVVEHTVARLSEIGADCHIGPYAALEPGSRIPSGTRTGPFYTAATAAELDD
jgi:bifunctional N-acetylglucosamine-1-phosphate-uridyltransferase/glucosamine-1-phosphate-acetyltransferase GlmU-like protein